jgi:hypothetical protein
MIKFVNCYFGSEFSGDNNLFKVLDSRKRIGYICYGLFRVKKQYNCN